MSDRSYASTGDYAYYAGLSRPPEDLDRRLMVRSSRRVDAVLIGAVYTVDENGMPTDPELREALRAATAEQARFSYDRGDKSGSGAVTQWGLVRIGDVHLSSPIAAASPTDKGVAPGTVCDTAENILRLARLLPITPWMIG